MKAIELSMTKDEQIADLEKQLASERENVKEAQEEAFAAYAEVDAIREQLAAERRKNEDWRNTERRVAKERDEARKQLAAAQNQISMDTECIERIRNHGMKLEIELAAERAKPHP